MTQQEETPSILGKDFGAAHRAYDFMRAFLARPPFRGTRLTAKRLFNLYLARYEEHRGCAVLRSLPIKLTIEPVNACNLRCPACFTGAGEVGRARSVMSLELYRKLLDELGDYLFEVELNNWGEPLLNKDIYTMMEEATARGISTTMSTNFSVPFDAERAERMVRSGLTVLGVSIDGARQETYEQYRVRGDLATVLDNCRLVIEAKRRLGSVTPHVFWCFHVFAHNVGDIELARTMARDLGMEISIEKGWVAGEEWAVGGAYKFFANVTPGRCDFLWHTAVVNNDGGVSPCCGSFYREDDMGRVATAPDTLGARTFREVWNGKVFQQARELFRSRENSGGGKQLLCFDCPQTLLWDSWKKHRAAGGGPSSFHVPYSTNDVFNYFFNRRPERAAGGRTAGGSRNDAA